MELDMRMLTKSGRSIATLGSLEGSIIRSVDGAKIGAVTTAIFDELEGKIVYLAVSDGGVLGLGEKFRPVPWEHFSFDPENAEYRADFSRETLMTAPAYDREQLASDVYGWAEQVGRHFDLSRGDNALSHR